MERRHQCSIHVLLCDGISGLMQPENTCMCWLLLWWCLVCSCMVSARRPLGFTNLIPLACSDLFIITFLAILLLTQQNDQQGIKRFFFPTAHNGWKTTGWGWPSALLDSCVSFWLSGGAGFCQEYLSLQCCHQMKMCRIYTCCHLQGNSPVLLKIFTI